jgi:uncharacterized membrane protein HdeD (DUF308 family)
MIDVMKRIIKVAAWIMIVSGLIDILLTKIPHANPWIPSWTLGLLSLSTGIAFLFMTR